jgi:hypothetical protein
MRAAQMAAGTVGIRQSRGDDGFVAGAESLVFGTLLFVLGTFVVINAWSVVDARLATSAAAREAVRAAVETPLDDDPHTRALAAGARAFAAHAGEGLALELVAEIPPEKRRCAPVRYRATTTVEVAGLGLPGAARRFTVSAAYAEVVDPHRSGLPEGIDCGW